MAQESNKRVKNDRLKRTLLLGFVFVCVIMIGAIWMEGIVEPEPATPSYYRGTFEVNDSYLTVTADALKNNPEPVGTPAADEHDEHQQGAGQGQGSGSGQGNGGGADH